MAIAFDTFGENRSAASGLTATATINPTGGANSYLVAGVVQGGDTGNLVTGVTWNGVSMTQTLAFDMNITNYYLYIYTLANPDIGNYNLVATRTASSGTIYVGGAFFTGVDSVDTSGTDGTSCGDTSSSISLTTTAADAVGILVSYNDNLSAISGVTNATGLGTPSFNGTQMFWSNGSLGAAGAKTMSVSGSSACFGSAGIALKPFTPTGPTTIKTLDGVSAI